MRRGIGIAEERGQEHQVTGRSSSSGFERGMYARKVSVCANLASTSREQLLFRLDLSLLGYLHVIKFRL